MGNTITAIFSVVTAEHAPSFYAGCVRCGKILDEGNWAVVLGIKNKHFLVGQFPLMKCCEADVRIPFLFRNKPDAKEKMDEVMERVRLDGGKLTAFSFFPVESFVPDKVH